MESHTGGKDRERERERVEINRDLTDTFASCDGVPNMSKTHAHIDAVTATREELKATVVSSNRTPSSSSSSSFTSTAPIPILVGDDVKMDLRNLGPRFIDVAVSDAGSTVVTRPSSTPSSSSSSSSSSSPSQTPALLVPTVAAYPACFVGATRRGSHNRYTQLCSKMEPLIENVLERMDSMGNLLESEEEQKRKMKLMSKFKRPVVEEESDSEEAIVNSSASEILGALDVRREKENITNDVEGGVPFSKPKNRVPDLVLHNECPINSVSPVDGNFPMRSRVFDYNLGFEQWSTTVVAVDKSNGSNGGTSGKGKIKMKGRMMSRSNSNDTNSSNNSNNNSNDNSKSGSGEFGLPHTPLGDKGRGSDSYEAHKTVSVTAKVILESGADLQVTENQNQNQNASRESKGDNSDRISGNEKGCSKEFEKENGTEKDKEEYVTVEKEVEKEVEKGVEVVKEAVKEVVKMNSTSETMMLHIQMTGPLPPRILDLDKALEPVIAATVRPVGRIKVTVPLLQLNSKAGVTGNDHIPPAKSPPLSPKVSPRNPLRINTSVPSQRASDLSLVASEGSDKKVSCENKGEKEGEGEGERDKERKGGDGGGGREGEGGERREGEGEGERVPVVTSGVTSLSASLKPSSASSSLILNNGSSFKQLQFQLRQQRHQQQYQPLDSVTHPDGGVGGAGTGMGMGPQGQGQVAGTGLGVIGGGSGLSSYRPNLHLEMSSLANSMSLHSPPQTSHSLAHRSVRELSLAQALAGEKRLNVPDEVENDEGDAQQELLTDKAVTVIRRVMDKLTGLDFYEPSSLAAPVALDVPEQVDRLIIQATANENLCLSFLGWCPFW